MNKSRGAHQPHSGARSSQPAMDPGSSSHPVYIGDIEKPHFFRIILPEILEDGTLELPPKFVDEYGQELAEFVSLEVLGDSPHAVEVERSDDGRISLQEGWQEFVERYSIESYHFLVFRYEGGSAFHVFIFDTGCTEIVYPVPEIVSESRPQNRRSGKEVIQYSRGFDESVAREQAVKRAKAFESPHPHFISIMRRSYLSRSFLYIPECEMTSHFHGREEDAIRVNGPDGRPWLMKYYVADPPRRQVRISVGWREFVKEYRLQDGDVCVFELYNIRDMAFNVRIFRVDEGEEGGRGT